MDWIQIINGLIVIIGIPTIAGVLISTGKKLNTLELIEEDLKDNVRPDLKEIREKFFAFEGKMNGVFKAHSPISLTTKGIEFLNKSGVKEYIDENLNIFLSLCANKKPTNAYDIQKFAFEFFGELKFPQEFEEKLKTYAFEQGEGVDTMRRVGAIYFRDLCLSHNKIDSTELDKVE